MKYVGTLKSGDQESSAERFDESGNYERLVPTSDSLWASGYIRNYSISHVLVVNFYNSRREDQIVYIDPLSTFIFKNQNIDRLQLSQKNVFKYGKFAYFMSLVQTQTEEESKSMLVYVSSEIKYDGLILADTKWTSFTIDGSNSGFISIPEGKEVVITGVTARINTENLPSNTPSYSDAMYISITGTEEGGNIINNFLESSFNQYKMSDSWENVFWKIPDIGSSNRVVGFGFVSDISDGYAGAVIEIDVQYIIV